VLSVVAQENKMKRLVLLTAVLLLNGCSVISLWPKPHDPVMFDNLVQIKILVDNLNCEDKTWAWETAETKINHLKVYSSLRNDPQAKSIAELSEAITKARNTDKKLFCEGIIKINKTRVDTIIDAWKGR
jgi:hypothetical protein